MKKCILFLTVALVQLSAIAQDTWKSDKAHSQLNFSVLHKGLADIMGTFKNFDVTIKSAQADFSDATIELTAEVASINTGIEMRDNHLKSADFFEVEAHPTMTFKSTSLNKSSTDKYTVTGDLTLHGVTKPVTMDLWYRGTVVDEKSKKATAGFKLTGTIKRSDFKIGAKFPAAMLSDDVAIMANGEFAK